MVVIMPTIFSLLLKSVKETFTAKQLKRFFF